MDKKELELYFHIPFCVRKCAYCDFLSAPATESLQEKYMEALLLETKGRADEFRDYRVSSVFIGGGTPSAVSEKWIVELMKAVGENYEFAKSRQCAEGIAMERESGGPEITIECNPGTLTKEKLLAYKNAGINRLSIGLQSADNGELRTLGRVHTYEEFLDGYRMSVEAGFDNINVDLMSGIPGQSLEAYETTLRRVLSLEPAPAHISAYSLIVEEGTLFYEKYERDELNLPDEDTDRRMYERTEEILSEAGYKRYEISNYAKEGFACRHNCGYWKRTEYAGFGIGAASLVKEIRFHNGSDMQKYLQNPMECREDMEELSIREQMEEFCFLGLRMTEGLDCEEFADKFGREIYEIYGGVIDKNISLGLLREYEQAGKRKLALTKRGLDLSNQVMADFLQS